MKYLYQKEIEASDEYDIIVCGGGPAGFTAAVQAGRLGAKTALVEKCGMLGGILTTGGNSDIALFYAHGKQIISGIGWEFVQRLNKKGWAVIPGFAANKPHWEQGVAVNTVMAAHEMDLMCEEANVALFFEQPLVDAITTPQNGYKKIGSIIVAAKTGLQALKAKIFIDCTGDGDAAFFSGAEFEKGDPVTKELQPGTLRFYFTGYEMSNLNYTQINDEYKKARENNELRLGDFWAGHPSALFDAKGNNINHVCLDGTDNESISNGQIEGRNSVARISDWARKHIEGAEKSEPIASSPSVGIRETRRIIGDEYITAQDYINARQYPDAVCYSFYPIDLHTHDINALVNVFHEEGKVPAIPYGALTPKGISNLLVAGRCISGDRLANSAYRVKASCMAMGQAAGVAAVLALDCRSDIRNVPIDKIKNTLHEHGAIVPGID